MKSKRIKAIRIALQKPWTSSDGIPRFGEEGKAIDHYVCYITNQQDDWAFMALGWKPGAFIGKPFNKSKNMYEGESSLSEEKVDLESTEIEICHYYGLKNFRYFSAEDFLRKHRLKYHWFVSKRDQVSDYFFNRSNLERRDQLNVLEFLVRSNVEKENYSFGELSVIFEMLGYRSVQHPSFDKLQRHYDLVLKALLENGDIQKHGGSGSYQVAPKALSTLAHFKNEERRHVDQVRQSWVIAALTVALVATAVVQAYAAYRGITST